LSALVGDGDDRAGLALALVVGGAPLEQVFVLIGNPA
jgi:hypothetical protein